MVRAMAANHAYSPQRRHAGGRDGVHPARRAALCGVPLRADEAATLKTVELVVHDSAMAKPVAKGDQRPMEPVAVLRLLCDKAEQRGRELALIRLVIIECLSARRWGGAVGVPGLSRTGRQCRLSPRLPALYRRACAPARALQRDGGRGRLGAG